MSVYEVLCFDCMENRSPVYSAGLFATHDAARAWMAEHYPEGPIEPGKYGAGYPKVVKRTVTGDAGEVVDWVTQPKRLETFLRMWSWFMTAFRLADLINNGYDDIARDLAGKIKPTAFPCDTAPISAAVESVSGRDIVLQPFVDPWLDEAERRRLAVRASERRG